jgi:hypothetical protein
MRTVFSVTGIFNITVECACMGREHNEDCEYDGQLKYEAADRALAAGVEVSYEEFIERQDQVMTDE